jgi:hypothetical protein
MVLPIRAVQSAFEVQGPCSRKPHGWLSWQLLIDLRGRKCFSAVGHLRSPCHL